MPVKKTATTCAATADIPTKLKLQDRALFKKRPFFECRRGNL
jgi:hypothetical protein